MFFMKKLISTILLITVFMTLILSGCKYNTSATVHVAEGFYFNTFVSVKLYGCGSEELAQEAVKLCEYYEHIFSRSQKESVLSIANTEQKLTKDNKDKTILYEVIKDSLQYAKLTEGALDITVKPLSELWNFTENEGKVPAQDEINKALENVDYSKITMDENEIIFNNAEIDCGAVAKGYVADRIKDFLIENKIDSAIINLGGNVLCIGDKPTGEDFVIGVKKPYSEEVILGLKIDDYSVVTSGVYERYFEADGVKYHHILNPDTGMPCENGLLSVTIVAESSFECDALSTGCFVMGLEKATELINNMDNVYAIFIDENYDIHYTHGAEKFVN